MPTILQFRRGTTAQNNNYTGSVGELTVDTDLYVLRVHDGSTAGGNQALVGDTTTQTLTNKTLTSPILTTPALGTPSSGTLSSCSGLPIDGGTTGTLPVARGGTGVTSSTGTGSVVLSNSPSLVTPALGTPSSGTLTNATGLPIVAGTTGTLSVARGGTGVTSSTGTGSVVLSTSPSLTTPALGTPSSGTLSSCSGLPIVAGTTGTLSVARGGTGVTSSTGSGSVVLSTSPTFSTKIITPVIEKSGTDGVGDIGQSGNKYATIYATTFSGTASTANYADLAEKYVADGHYEPGTVMVFGGEKEVTASLLSYETAIAGVISTAPAYLMNNELNEENTVSIALVGRVPCKVMGPVSKGTVLVTSEHAGVAMAIDNSKFLPGSIIGRAMEEHLELGVIKTIEVSVGRS